FDCKHDAPEAQRVRRCDRRFNLDQFGIAKLRQLKPPVPIWGPHHNDVDVDTFEPVDAVHPRALDRHLAFERHAERGEKSDSGCKVVDDDADVVQSLDRHVPSIADAVRAGGAMSKTRLEAFSDSVLAIIITIMVLELKVPHGVEAIDLRPLFPGFLS